MNTNDNFIDRTLLRLRRNYSKDEVISALDKKLKEVEYENGILKSEVSELEYLRTENERISKQLKGKELQVSELLSSNEKKAALKREIEELKIYIQHLENKIY